MNRARRRLITIVSVMACGARLLWTPGAVAGQGTEDAVASAECCISLLSSIGARALGVGGAVVAHGGAGALFANPAALAELLRDEFLVYNASTTLEKSNTFSLVIRSEVIGSLALSFRVIDFGEQDANDENGVKTGTLAIYNQVLTASYATHVGGGVNAGINYTLYQERKDCRGFCNSEALSATTHGIDFGVQYRPSRLPALQIGASVTHLGFPLQVVNAGQASPMPVRVRMGGAYDVSRHILSDSTTALTLALDAVFNPRDPGESFANAGAELSLDETIFVWAGYAGGTGLLGGAAIGVGLDYDRFDVGIARAFASTAIASEPVHITFGIRF